MKKRDKNLSSTKSIINTVQMI